MFFTRDVLDKLIEEACDKCHWPYVCQTDDELQDHCKECYIDKIAEFLAVLQ